MTATGFGNDDKVSKSGDTMTGTLHFRGTPPYDVSRNVNGGLVTLNGTTAVSVATVAIDANTLVMLAVQPGAVPAGQPYVSSITTGTGFTVKSTSGADTAVVVAWYLVDAV